MDFRRKDIRLHPSRYRGRTWFFITICCEGRRLVLADKRESEDVIACLKSTAERCQFAVHAYCVMPDHFHALVEGLAPDSDLLKFVRNFKRTSNYSYSERCGTTLWQKKFYDHILRAKDAPEAVCWYIWMNPVRKGLCSQPHEYDYSGSLTQDWKRILNPEKQWTPTWKGNPYDKHATGMAP
jgi:REP element-mobilizing transposase RayT